MSSTPYYYKSPVKRYNNSSGRDNDGIKRNVSKSPIQSSVPKHGISANITQYIKLMDEFKQISNHIDETNIELNHLTMMFNKRYRLLKDETIIEQANHLRDNSDIPYNEESTNN